MMFKFFLVPSIAYPSKVNVGFPSRFNPGVKDLQL